MARQKVKYLSNKELLLEIHRSKKSYCSYVDDQYSDYDLIVNSVDLLKDPETIQQGKEARAKRLKELHVRDLLLQGEDPKKHDTDIDADSINVEDIVFRVMTYEHIPLELERKKSHKTEADRRTKVPFPPFKHYIIENKKPKEVGKSHWEGGLHNGAFSVEHGRITNRLGDMFDKLVRRYSMKPNWRGYSYIDEMRSQALLQLSKAGLKFDESRSANPFAFYTEVIKNSFRGELLNEKKVQNLRDELLMQAGSNPSHTKMVENEMEQRKEAEEDEK